jgi:hypothetical protein
MLHASGLVPARFLCIIGKNNFKPKIPANPELFQITKLCIPVFLLSTKMKRTSSSFSCSGEKLVVSMPNTGRLE